MGNIYKKTVTRPIPERADIITRQGVRCAVWVDRQGRKQTAPITDAGRIRVQAATYTARYRAGDGTMREKSTGCRTKDAARSKLAELESRAEKVRSGIISEAEDVAGDWAHIPIAAHIRDYIEHLRARECCESHRKTRESQLKKLCDECGFRRLVDLDASAMERWLAIEADKDRGARSRNSFRETMVAFANWAVKYGRLISNPFAKIQKANEAADRKRIRRAFTPDELGKLLAATAARPLHDARHKNRNLKADLKAATVAKLKRLGNERVMIYKTLATTGLRMGELAALTIADLHLEGTAPTLTLPAAVEKNRKGATLPVQAALAVELRAWAAGLLATRRADSEATGKPIPAMLPMSAPLFEVPAGLLKILNRDMVFAGIEKTDRHGRILDVHSFRLTFGTMLQAAGVPLRTAQALMRHSDPALTANVYTDPALLDMAGALDALPNLQPQAEQIAKQASATVVSSVVLDVCNDMHLGASVCSMAQIEASPKNTAGSGEIGNECKGMQAYAGVCSENENGVPGKNRTRNLLVRSQGEEICKRIESQGVTEALSDGCVDGCTETPDSGEIEALRAEVARLRAELDRLG